MTSPKETPQDDARSRILEASLDLFSEKGFHGATTRKIAEKAGVNEVTLFRNFKNKMTLFLEVLNEAKKIGFDVNTHTGVDIEPEEVIRLMVETTFEIVEKYPREIRFLHLAVLDGIEKFEEGFVKESHEAAVMFAADAIKKLQDRNIITSTEDPVILAHMLFSMMLEMAMQRVIRKNSPLLQYDRKILCDAIIRFFIA